MKKRLLIISYLLFSLKISAQNIIYVSPTGSASSNGSIISQPTTLTNAITLATNADVTIYLRGGTYTFSTTISIPSSRNGAAGALKKLWAYPNDARPVLDFSAMAIASNNRGVSLSASYWHIKGIDIFKAGDNGMFMSGSNNIIEFCSFSENGDSGLQIGGGASNNQVINCDSYFNADPTFENADGFAAKLDVGTGNVFKGCRAWQNVDDGWDGYLRPATNVSTRYEDCWSFKNGFDKNGNPTGALGGDGNGFKMGGSDAKDLAHNATLIRCLSFMNASDGFDQNSNKGSMILYNCTAFSNGRNYGMADVLLDAGKTMELKNCISAGTGNRSILSSAILATNSWSSGFTVSNADFQSIDPAAAYGARQADGSLPNMTFMHLAATSSLINRGTNIGLPFNESAPDLGCFETGSSTGLRDFSAKTMYLGLFPNPVSDAATVEYQTNTTEKAVIKIHNILGQTVFEMQYTPDTEGGQKIPIQTAFLPKGNYFLEIKTNKQRETVQFVKF